MIPSRAQVDPGVCCCYKAVQSLAWISLVDFSVLVALLCCYAGKGKDFLEEKQPLLWVTPSCPVSSLDL